jgi:hypothetical protein
MLIPRKTSSDGSRAAAAGGEPISTGATVVGAISPVL